MKEIQVLHTEEYDLFSDITSNREVDRRHVKGLMSAIRENNLLHLNAIIVNSAMQVIDGQHRLEAARELKVPIYYVVDDQVSKKHIAGLNSNMKNWNMLDYVNYYAVEGVQEYLILSNFIVNYPQVPVSTLLQLLNPRGERDTKSFKNGHLCVDNQDKARDILDHINKVRNTGVEHVYDRNFILAMKDAYQVEGYKPEQFLDKLKGHTMDLVKCAKKQQYLQLIEGIYNRHQQHRLRFY